MFVLYDDVQMNQQTVRNTNVFESGWQNVDWAIMRERAKRESTSEIVMTQLVIFLFGLLLGPSVLFTLFYIV